MHHCALRSHVRHIAQQAEIISQKIDKIDRRRSRYPPAIYLQMLKHYLG